jgi:hypothetical protein
MITLQLTSQRLLADKWVHVEDAAQAVELCAEY